MRKDLLGKLFIPYGAGILLVAVFAATTVIVGVMEYEFLIWDDNRIVDELQSRRDSTIALPAWLANTNVTFLFTPVSLLLFGLLADIFGIVPMPFHAAVVFLHLLNTFLVYLLIIRLFELIPATNSVPLIQPLVAATAAGLWGMHVLRAEVIGWVAAMPYALSTALALFAIHAFISSLRKSSAPRFGYWLSFVLYCFSVLAHPQTVPVCFVFLALDYYFTDQTPSNTKAQLPVIYFVRRHAAFFAAGLLTVFVGVAVRSSVPSMPFQLPVDLFSLASVELVKLLGFISDFALLHAWLPQQVSNVYNGYGVADLFSPSSFASLLLFSVIVFIGIQRWLIGNKGLSLALLCHIAFCIPAAGLFMPQYFPGDRFIYGLTIIAVIVFAFALRSGCVFITKRLNTTSLIRAFSVCLASIALVLPIMCLSGLVAELHNWKNTHTLMVHFQNTAPSQELRFFFKLRDYDYWQIKGDIPQMQQALLSFLDSPYKNKEEALVNSVQYLAERTLCSEARYLAQAANKQIAVPDAVAAEINQWIWLCHRYGTTTR